MADAVPEANSAGLARDMGDMCHSLRHICANIPDKGPQETAALGDAASALDKARQRLLDYAAFRDNGIE